MKKSLTILTIAILAIVAFAGFVNAGQINVPSTVKQGDVFDVVVSLNTPVSAADFQMKFDPSKFELQATGTNGGVEMYNVSTSDAKTALYSYDNPTGSTQTLTLKFKALTNAELGTTTFTVVEPTLVKVGEVAETGETIDPSSVSVEIVAPTPDEGNNPADKDDTNNQEDDNKGEEEKIVDKKGNTITSITNAGTPVFAGVIALIVIAGAVLVIRNRK